MKTAAERMRKYRARLTLKRAAQRARQLGCTDTDIAAVTGISVTHTVPPVADSFTRTAPSVTRISVTTPHPQKALTP